MLGKLISMVVVTVAFAACGGSEGDPEGAADCGVGCVDPADSSERSDVVTTDAPGSDRTAAVDAGARDGALDVLVADTSVAGEAGDDATWEGEGAVDADSHDTDAQSTPDGAADVISDSLANAIADGPADAFSDGAADSPSSDAPPKPDGCASGSDDPDALYVDDNCDGIDGDLSKAILVAKNAIGAVDDATCGVSVAKPCLTIGQGLVRAGMAARPDVYVQAGTYPEVVKLANGKRIFGGYDINWQRAGRATAGHTVTIIGAKETSEQQFVTVWAHDIAETAVLADVVLAGPVVSAADNGASTYVVHARNANATLRNVDVLASNGAPGMAGTTLSNRDAPSVAASASMNAAPYGQPNGPGAAVDGTNTCDDSLGGVGGLSGTNACSDPLPAASRSVSAGAGGRGGKKDAQCCCDTGIAVVCGGFCCGAYCNATSGTAGITAGYANGAYGGGGGAGALCAQGGDAESGRVANGGPGLAGTGSGSLSGGTFYWTGRAGTAGTTGDHGSGGGGGGGAGGCDSGAILQNTRGPGGGGGGAGGCAARRAGGGGQPGGSSFGIFAASSVLELADAHIARANGGAGGPGGEGGRGQDAGSSASGAPAGAMGGRGGNGGAGAHGGHAGGGGGGTGGHSYGIYKYNATITKTGTTTFAGGSKGIGGAGGTSGGNAPAPKDIADAPKGDDGQSADEGTCSAAGAC